MRPDQIEGSEIAHTFIELRRPPEVGEEEGQARDLQALVNVECVGAIDIPEGLVRENALGGQEGAALSEHMMHGIIRNADRRQGADVGMIFDGYPQSSGMHHQRVVVAMRPVEHQRKILPILCRFSLYVDELCGVRHRLEDDDEGFRDLKRYDALPAGRQFQSLDDELVDHRLVVAFRQIDARAPVDLAEVFCGRKLVGVMSLDPPDIGTDRERHLDHLVERRLVASGA
ncbi:hypothetical protein D3C87_1540210 [compost metagenome]